MKVQRYKNFSYTVRKGENEVFYAEAYDEGGTEIIGDGETSEESELNMRDMIDEYVELMG